MDSNEIFNAIYPRDSYLASISKKIKSSNKISEVNKKLIFKYADSVKAKGIGRERTIIILRFLKGRGFPEITRIQFEG